ncbi:MAG: type IX secretion system plug protein domain-containing protein, partial [Cyclobacteriaceae bacterium]
MRLTTLLLLVLTALPGLPASGLAKKWELADRTYEETIRTVQVYPAGATPLAPAVAGLRAQNLVLEFDDLVSDRASYYARYVHCNYDWTKSILMDLDILDQFNEFPINDFIYSNNESTPYVHYTLRLPPVKLPGNYVLVVYREGNREDVLLTKRFMITDTRATVSLQDNLSGRGTLSTSNQLLNFLVNYRNLEIINPLETVHVVIRQNQRWDNVKNNVQPAFVREDIRQLEYRFFEQDEMFAAGNEFRFVDFRSVNFPGQNTDRLDRKRKPFQLWVAFDRSRESEAYALYR